MRDVRRVRRTGVIYRRVNDAEAGEAPACLFAFPADGRGRLPLHARLLVVHPAAQPSAPSLLRMSEELRARLAGVAKPAAGGRSGKARKQ